MTTMNISLTDELKAFVDEQVATGDYTTSSEYVRSLIRREKDVKELRKVLLQGANSGIAEAVDEGYFENLRERVRNGEFK